MNLQKAIEILTETQKLPETWPKTDYDNAIKLGIEALKRVQFYNRELKALDPPLLPGETKE